MFVDVPQPNPMHGFSQDFEDMFIPRLSRADKFLGGICQELLPWQHFEYFSDLTFVYVPQPQPIHGFLSNFQYLHLSRFGRVLDSICCHGNALNTFQSSS